MDSCPKTPVAENWNTSFHGVSRVCVGIRIWYNSIFTHNNATKFSTWHNSCAVMPCGKFCGYHIVTFLTHWGRVTHICVGKLTIIGSDNGLSPGRRQAIIWTDAGIVLILPLGTNFSEILKGIQTFSFKKMHLKMSSSKWRPFVSAAMC